VVVRRLRIKVEHFPRFGEDLELRTFCTGIGRFSAERLHVSIMHPGR
jgi:acyl-ACP thioesterase